MHFADLPSEYCALDTSKIVILPVPFDLTSTWIKGADKGPDAILEASANMETFDIETQSEVYTMGIHTAEPLQHLDSVDNMVASVRQRVAECLEKEKFPVLIGGEHSVTIGAVQAHAKHTSNLTVLQLDAHSDLRDAYHDSKYNHACVMARVNELCPSVQVGIRSESSEGQKADPDRIFYAKDIYHHRNWFDAATGKLTDNVYITIDLDVFDPSIMPATGTPEPGGLLWYDVLAFLKKVIETKNVVGFDVVELCPITGQAAPNFLAAKLIYKLLSYRFSTFQ